MFKFQHPEYLWLFATLPLICGLWVFYQLWRQKALQRLGDTSRLMPAFSTFRFWTRGVLLLLAFSFLAIAWANPQLGEKKGSASQEAADVFIALDISQSMLCRDVAPSRLDLARIFSQKLVQSLEGERIGLIFFAGDAFLAVPLSTDYSFVLQSIQSASPDLLTEQGTALAPAIERAEQSFDAEPGGGRAIILISDGENHDEDALDAAKKAFDAGTLVMSVGAGTEEGGPIPGGDWEGSQYKRDEKGDVVRSRLNEKMLRQLALSGGGSYYRLGQNERAISAIKRQIDGLQKRSMEVRAYGEMRSWYQWFLLPALLLLGLETWLSFNRKKQVIT